MANTGYNPHVKEERKGQEQQDKAKDTASDTMTKAKEAGKDMMGTAKEMGGEALDKARDVGASVVGKARDAASAVGEVATTAATNVGKRAEDMTAAAGHSIREFGDNLAHKAPQGGIAGTASSALAEGIRTSGQYIEQHKLSGMAQDVETVIKNHPIPAILICLGLGFCLGRVMSD